MVKWYLHGAYSIQGRSAPVSCFIQIACMWCGLYQRSPMIGAEHSPQSPRPALALKHRTIVEPRASPTHPSSLALFSAAWRCLALFGVPWRRKEARCVSCVRREEKVPHKCPSRTHTRRSILTWGGRWILRHCDEISGSDRMMRPHVRTHRVRVGWHPTQQ